MLDFLLSNDSLAALLAFVIVLIPAVVIHELGHFFAAKAAGITILEFGIGFPPRIGKLFTWRGTEFTLNLLPLGGFVRPLGEDMVSQQGDDAENVDRKEAVRRGIEDPKSVNDAAPLSRIGFLSAGAIANLVTAFVLFVVIAMMGIVDFVGGRINVIHVNPNASLAQAGLQSNDVIELIDGEYFSELEPESFFERLAAVEAGEEVVLTVRRAESQEPIALAYTVPEETGIAEGQERFVRVMGIVEGAPADRAGIAPGDLIASFNGETVTSNQQLINLTNTNLGQSVELGLQRGGERFEASLIPRENPPEGEGSMGVTIQEAAQDLASGVIYQPGIPHQVIVQLSFTEGVRYAVDRYVSLFQAIVQFPSEIAQGTVTREAARPVSIVGISQAGGVFLQQSIEENNPVRLLNFIALISIALGFTNLLPIPALDGGRILFVLIEIIRGRPIAPEREGLVHLLGLAFLLSLTVIVVINDLVNPITEMIP